MTTLLTKLPLPEKRAEIVSSCCRLLDAEVGRKGGLSGLAVKAGYAVLKAIKPGAVAEAIDVLLDDFLGALEPFHGAFEKEGEAGFGGHLKEHAAQVAEALLKVTDRRAEQSKHGSLRGMYHKLRPSALRNVQEAVPGLADLVDRYYRK
jgi:hypothetical protein